MYSKSKLICNSRLRQDQPPTPQKEKGRKHTKSDAQLWISWEYYHSQRCWSNTVWNDKMYFSATTWELFWLSINLIFLPISMHRFSFLFPYSYFQTQWIDKNSIVGQGQDTWVSFLNIHNLSFLKIPTYYLLTGNFVCQNFILK